MRFAHFVLLMLFGSFWGGAVDAQDKSLLIDPNGRIAEIFDQRGWIVQTHPIDESFVEGIAKGYNSTDPAAVSRMIEALRTTYIGGTIKGNWGPNDPYRVMYLEKDGGIVLIRLHLFTLTASDSDRAEFFTLVEAMMNEPLRQSGDETLKRVWRAYQNKEARQFSHGWENLSQVENRAMAWGVPPDFLEIVVTTRTDCEFLPVKGWMARQICP